MIDYTVCSPLKRGTSESLIIDLRDLGHYTKHFPLLKSLKKKDFPKPGSFRDFYDVDSKTFIVILALDESKLTTAHLLIKQIVDRLAEYSVKTLQIDVHNNDLLKYFAQWIEESTFSYDDLKTKKKTLTIKKVCFLTKSLKHDEPVIMNAVYKAKGMAQTRYLAEMPSNLCTPKYLTKHALQLEKKSRYLQVSILDKKQIKTMKMNSFLSVSQGSHEGAYLISMEYKKKSKNAPIVFVGKGITFDTGGHSLKPSSSMMGMKFDMCGAATVFGIFEYLTLAQPDIHVIGLIPTCENIPGGSANKPDDVVTSMSGQTIEILNTDAEGRLILCDALTYAERFKPSYVIDIATLTGACLATFGTVVTGMMGNDQGLMDKIEKAGNSSLDRVWPLPLWDEFQEMIHSPVADMANIGSGHAGTITAGCFLSRFTKKYKWAHLDIAGTACQFKGHKRGATGRPVALLTEFIEDCAQSL